jgi:predicted transglutaminase-like cysteine proteinase
VQCKWFVGCLAQQDRGQRLRDAFLAFRIVILLAIVFPRLGPVVEAASAPQLYAVVGQRTQTPPVGWVQFCETYAAECATDPLPPRDIVLDKKAWTDLNRINIWANHNVKPMTDMDHYGMVQWWRYPDDGAGACHSYALLKRRLLMQAGWARQALLMTIVHQLSGEGHAVLTVKTDRGEFILDNLTDDVRLWSKTPYRYYERQSQDDPNVWIRLDDFRLDLSTLLDPPLVDTYHQY